MNLAMGMWLCNMWLCLLGFDIKRMGVKFTCHPSKLGFFILGSMCVDSFQAGLTVVFISGTIHFT